jgi:hypothetical protein
MIYDLPDAEAVTMQSDEHRERPLAIRRKAQGR